MSESDAPGVAEAGDGLTFLVFGVAEEVEDVDGSTVTIERLYAEPRQQSYLGVGERGHLIPSEDAPPAAD